MKALLLLVGLLYFPVMAEAGPPPPPQTVIIVSCRVDDLTGQPGRQDPALAARGWMDLEWHFDKGNELECKREELPLTDSVALMSPEVQELKPNFSAWAQCAAVAMQVGPAYEKAHKGWAVAAVGCPSPMMDDNGTPSTADDRVVGWTLPSCPSWLKCRYDGSLI
jgi:hypothetical protein